MFYGKDMFLSMEKKTPLKEMPPKKRIGYIWDYYKWFIIIGLAIIIAVVSFIHSKVTAPNEVFSVLYVNSHSGLDDVDLQAPYTDFLESRGLDLDTNEVNVNNSLDFVPDDTSYYQQITTMTTYLAVHEYSLVLSDQAVFEHYSSTDAFMDIRDYVSQENLEKYADDIQYTKNADTGEEYPCGIHLTEENCKWLADMGLYDECYLSFCYSELEDEFMLDLTDYLLQ